MGNWRMPVALIKTWTPKDKMEWALWLRERPKVIKDMAEKLPPNLLYRYKETGQIGFLLSYSENGTVKAAFPNELNFQMSTPGGRQVFGLPPDGFEECDYPPADKLVGPLADGTICKFSETDFYKDSKAQGLIGD